MAEEIQPVPQEEHAHLEEDITRLSHEVQRIKEAPENRGLSGKELIKKSLQALPPTVSLPSEPQGDGALPSYAAGMPPEIKLEIERLLDLAFHKGIMQANEEARQHEPFVLDAFHDALAGRLYLKFQKRGVVE
jgi:hypothetical protein